MAGRGPDPPSGGDPRALTLYTYHRNSAGERVRIALALKGVAYAYVSAPAMGMDLYRAEINAQGLLPALRVGDTVVAQSMAILEYLDEVYPEPPLLPAGPIRRAQARAFAQLIVSDIHPLGNQRVRRRLGGAHDQDAAAVDAWVRHWMAVGLRSLEEQLRQCGGDRQPYCFGDAPGLAEVCLTPLLHNARRFGCPLEAYPTLVAVDALCRTLSAFAAARPAEQPDYPGQS